MRREATSCTSTSVAAPARRPGRCTPPGTCGCLPPRCTPAAARLVARRRPAAAFAPVDAQAPAGASALVLELPDAPALAGASALVLDLPDAAGPAGASALAAELPDEPALGPDPADTSSPGVNPAGRPRSREHPDARAAARW